MALVRGTNPRPRGRLRDEFSLAELLGEQLRDAVAGREAALAEAQRLRAELAERAYAELVGERVVVTTKDGHTIEGDLVRLYVDGFRLEGSRYGLGAAREIGGSVVVDRENVSWIQRPGEPPPPRDPTKPAP